MVELDCIGSAAAAVTPPRCFEGDLVWFLVSVCAAKGKRQDIGAPRTKDLLAKTSALWFRPRWSSTMEGMACCEACFPTFSCT